LRSEGSIPKAAAQAAFYDPEFFVIKNNYEATPGQETSTQDAIKRTYRLFPHSILRFSSFLYDNDCGFWDIQISSIKLP